ncbi:MAG TPA: bifunctional phosphopantothenoylcysteine decarboxylase/phosphopantothenate--cysteine ligase CoaBC [Thermoplasmatales archaeon]|nr:bifunctional phosphopantothenoylcysteine decarboxylase/phosphopantothenate--cysteine ligase CoaBC [Thermoplasmatales archaeon]
MHPVEEIREERSSKLRGKRILLCVTGSVAAVESFYLCRDLIRHGADVVPVMSEAATKIIHPDALEFASGHKPVLSLTGGVEHVSFCGESTDKVDMVLVSPCTLNTLSKVVLGICDNVVTACTVTALGSGIPVVVVPAMHLSMYRNPVTVKNLRLAEELGVYVVKPELTETKARIAGRDEIVANVIRILGVRDFVGKKVLVIGGASAESLDDIRVLTNRSSGKMGVALAKNVFERGGDVELWLGWSRLKPPEYLRVKRFESVMDLHEMVRNDEAKGFDVVIVCAALSNYLPEKRKGKIGSGEKELRIGFRETPSVVDLIKRKHKDVFLVAFKAEENKEVLEEKAKAFLRRKGVDMVVANTLSAFGAEESEVLIVDGKNRVYNVKGGKDVLAEEILSYVGR